MTSAQAERGQEALQDFLSSWQDALAHMATPHQNMAVATEQLKSLRHTFSAYLEEVESAAKSIDNATASPAPSAELLAKRNELKARLQEKQKHLKVVIDKLRGLQNDITVLSYANVTND